MKKKVPTVTHIMGLVSVGVSIHKYSKSNELVHVAEYGTCEEQGRYIRVFLTNSLTTNCTGCLSCLLCL